MNFASLLRRQMRTPFFTVTVIVLIAFVVAINAAAFGAIHALRWKALPYADADNLVDLQAELPKFGFTLGLTEKLREDIVVDKAHFSGALGFVKTRGEEDGRSWQMLRVSQEFSQVLGVSAALGRSFAPTDAKPGDDAVLVLSDAIWRARFNADPNVIGQQVRLHDRSYSVIGVMPRGFAFPDATTDAWRPYVMTDAERAQSEKGNVGDIDVVARLAPGTSVDQAHAALAAILEHEPSMQGLRGGPGLSAHARLWRERFTAAHWQSLALLQLAALVLLAVVAANLVNLQLDRLLARSRELEIRRAIGASEAAILRGVMLDLGAPVAIGLGLGLVLAPLLLGLIQQRGLLPDDLAQGSGFGVAMMGAGLAVTLAVLSSASLAIFAARRSSSLSSRAGITGLGRVRPAMLVAQVMLTTALLGSSGLLLRSAVNLVSIDAGFDTRGVVLTAIDPVGVSMRGKHYNANTDAARFRPMVESLRADIANLPGVDYAAVSTMPPFSGWESVSSIRLPGETDNREVRDRGVGPGYFSALGIGLGAGRDFEPTDFGEASPVIVDELYRDRFLRDGDTLSAYVEIPIDADNYRRARIIGVVHTVKHESLGEAANLPTLYHFNAAPLPIFWLVTRTSLDPAAFAETLRQQIHTHMPDVDIGVNKPMSELVGKTLSGRRALLEALGGFAIATLILAALGLTAVLGFAVRRRLPEFGVRMALGAKASRIIGLVMRQGGALIALGTALGVALGIPLARLLSDRLFGIAFSDPQTWTATALIVSAVAAFACWLPAWRAAAVDPTIALRHE
ncbi:FtsX-like permease family protein [Pseudolysobacter antarcticus]|uniref:FtsX-like permease family protein n=1 Tax=Pseudolysobacter antarcticus TaxID=2511995 RepID=A0A411HF46_9GAMM|nr:FtsX-like permease family protein [Pseudolysobacter antarcticus]QBB69108.1 FtsX-like permease family protein [Pseudolysobacter antarcticus]